MSQTITLLPGDGIGPEVTEATLRVLAAAGAEFDYEPMIAGAEAVEGFRKVMLGIRSSDEDRARFERDWMPRR